MLIARGLLVALAALLLAVQVVRNSAVDALAKLQPHAAAGLWRGHPAVEISLGLTEIGRAARAGKTIDPQVFAMINDAAAKSPLSPQPFLVRGVQAQSGGDGEAARRAFQAAQWRDPRSLPAAYFLAEYYFRAGQPLQGLIQTALLARLSPQGTDAVAPFVAAYARERSNWPAIRALFRSQEGLEDGVLTALARDGRNADAVLALADSEHRRPDSPWLPVLLNSLVEAGDYARARAIWTSIGGARDAAGSLLYDAGFASAGPPPPFNWTLSTTTIGLAERQPGGRLHVLFYGNQDGPLASQLLLLAPGMYRLQMHVVGSPAHPETLQWSIRCDKATEPLATAALTDVATRGWTFPVPPTCRAQWLELVGRTGDVAQQADVTIGGLKLTRAGGNA